MVVTFDERVDRDGMDGNVPRTNVIQDELPGAPFAGARACVDRGRMSAFLRFGRDHCG